jgi:hypothetical protein
MPITLESLAGECRRVLASDSTPGGREQVAALVARALRDDAFLRAQFADQVPERKILYEDTELGFCILAHEYSGAKEGGPHDHGPSWAIYGQAEGETVMADFEVVEAAAPGRAGKVRRTRSYPMRAGDVHVYNEGAVHAPSRSGPTRLIRVEGVNLEKVARGRYEVLPG